MTNHNAMTNVNTVRVKNIKSDKAIYKKLCEGFGTSTEDVRGSILEQEDGTTEVYIDMKRINSQGLPYQRKKIVEIVCATIPNVKQVIIEGVPMQVSE